MNILRRYIYTHTREELEWPIITVIVDSRIAARLVLECDITLKKIGGKKFGIPETRDGS